MSDTDRTHCEDCGATILPAQDDQLADTIVALRPPATLPRVKRPRGLVVPLEAPVPPGQEEAAVALVEAQVGHFVLYLAIWRPASPTEKAGWTLPGGKQEVGERLGETCLRELHEETGLLAKNNSCLYWKTMSSLRHGRPVHVFHVGTYGGSLRSEHPDQPIGFATKEALLAGPFGAFYKEMFRKETI